MKKEALDAMDVAPSKSKYGKNFESLVGAGAWTIFDFKYKPSRCGCCGRSIVRTLVLKNNAHVAIKARDPDHRFDELIEIGIVCGPRVFAESCRGFYEDPKREWEREWASWKDYINYIILCVQGEPSWKRVPKELRSAIDLYLDEGFKEATHSGTWWYLKDTKKRFLVWSTNKDKTIKPARSVSFLAARLLRAAHAVGKCTDIVEIHPMDDETFELKRAMSNA